jgi:plasmid stabilization system protein ParE
MQRLVLTESAKNDLDEIWFYIAAESGSIESAERVIWRLHRTITKLTATPGMGRRCDDIDPKGRCFPAGNYIVYYREESRRIVITHVFHGNRDQAKGQKQAPYRGRKSKKAK